MTRLSRRCRQTLYISRTLTHDFTPFSAQTTSSTIYHSMPRHSRHNTVLSEDDDDDEELLEVPQPKRQRRSRDHTSDIELFDERTRGQRGHRRPSSKQASNGTFLTLLVILVYRVKEYITERDAAEEQIRKLTRQLAKAKRDVARELNGTLSIDVFSSTNNAVIFIILSLVQASRTRTRTPLRARMMTIWRRGRFR